MTVQTQLETAILVGVVIGLGFGVVIVLCVWREDSKKCEEHDRELKARQLRAVSAIKDVTK